MADKASTKLMHIIIKTPTNNYRNNMMTIIKRISSRYNTTLLTTLLMRTSWYNHNKPKHNNQNHIHTLCGAIYMQPIHILYSLCFRALQVRYPTKPDRYLQNYIATVYFTLCRTYHMMWLYWNWSNEDVSHILRIGHVRWVSTKLADPMNQFFRFKSDNSCCLFTLFERDEAANVKNSNRCQI